MPAAVAVSVGGAETLTSTWPNRLSDVRSAMLSDWTPRVSWPSTETSCVRVSVETVSLRVTAEADPGS